MAGIELDKPARELMLRQLGRYLKVELDVEIGGLPAEFLLDFLTEHLGPHYYNQGLQDARTAFLKRVDEIGETIYELEKPTPKG
ncbi:MAG: DUF2164 domain-containing protein [Caulobacter sp.]|nr:DUF2164 domain-containing protein [Caulobacter sp.]